MLKMFSEFSKCCNHAGLSKCCRGCELSTLKMLQSFPKMFANAAEPTDVAVHSMSWVFFFSFGLLCPPCKAKYIRQNRDPK